MQNKNVFSLTDEYQRGNHALGCNDAKKYARRDLWSNLEACLLLSGIDPLKFLTPEMTYKDLLSFSDLFDIDPISAENRLRELYDASENSRQFKVSTRPIEFILWAIHLQLCIPSELTKHVLEFTRQTPSWGTPKNHQGIDMPSAQAENWIYDANYLHRVNLTERHEETAGNDNAHLDKRKINTLQKLAVGLAMERFEYDPRKARNRTGDIKGALERKGISLDQTTIKTTLDECLNDIDYDLSLLDDAV